MAENSDNQEFVVLEGEQVVKLPQEISGFLNLNVNKLGYLCLTEEQLVWAIIRQVNLHSKTINELFYDNYDGPECEVLRPGTKGWQKGKIKVALNIEFYPDEPEEEIEEKESSESDNEGENSGDNNSKILETEVSPLDDLRQKFNQENQ
ncbi:MAG: hypothetical protein F6K22_17405 [Okeania sp. SIO2F4]|uniref:KGK domain-containing protein n=1 Tax=Okeania sp. SIO2F4 TaxID=2607790 RepID=UPI001429FA21|nr:KGK domain-containing protein [Okeania sp. SIO2F4]NES04449.1 hypothetical protein [Okeania sp. SIO2F4]